MQNKDGLEIERRFLLEAAPELSALAGTPTKIEQVYLKKPGAGRHETHRLRRATASNGETNYYYTIKSPAKEGARNEREREITPEEYAGLIQHRDPERRAIRKTRHAIPLGEHTLELDIFEAELAGLIILEIELASFDVPLELPDWAKSAKEITHDSWFSNFNLSHADVEEVRARIRKQLEA